MRCLFFLPIDLLEIFMIICTSRRFIFVHIHKCGGSSLEIGIEPFMKWNDILLGSTRLGEAINEEYRQKYGLHKHSPLSEIRDVIGNQLCNDMYAFALVRHPVGRIVSLYNFLATTVENIACCRTISIETLCRDVDLISKDVPELRWHSVRVYLDSDFSSFIRNASLLEWDLAFRSQSDMLMTENKIAAEWFKLEDIEQNIHVIRAKTGLDFQMPHENKSARKAIRYKDIQSRDYDWLCSLYRQDFINLGYS